MKVHNYFDSTEHVCEKVINVFQVMHGGLFSKDGVTLDDIRSIERNRQPPEEGMLERC